MPVISCFFGIYVRMYFNDHEPPHIHVEYQGHEALVGIVDGSVLEGSLPRQCHGIVRSWCIEHQAKLFDNWSKAKRLEPLSRIPGADQ